MFKKNSHEKEKDPYIFDELTEIIEVINLTPKSSVTRTTFRSTKSKEKSKFRRLKDYCLRIKQRGLNQYGGKRTSRSKPFVRKKNILKVLNMPISKRRILKKKY